MENKYMYFKKILLLKIHNAWIVLKSVTFVYVAAAIF